MKLHFFGTTDSKPSLEENLIRYILSLLDPKSLGITALVNKEWHQLVTLTRSYLKLLPTIQSIPGFETVGLDVIQLKILTGGMTNTNYILSIRYFDDAVLRVPGIGTDSYLSREDEARNTLQASQAGLSPPVIYQDPDSGLKLTKYISGARELDEHALARKEILSKIADLMHRLHTSVPFKNQISIFDRNKYLLDTLKSKGFDLPGRIGFIEEQMTYLEKLFSQYVIEMHSCHNDTTPLNFLLFDEETDGGEKEKLLEIDMEYSGSNDFMWDLAYFGVEAKLSRVQELILLNSYFGEEQVNESVIAWFDIYKPIVESWITFWYWTQLTNKATAVEPENYRQKGEECYQRTLDYLSSKEYKDAFDFIQSQSEPMAGNRSFSC